MSQKLTPVQRDHCRANGICTACGHRPAENGFVMCPRCRKAARDKRKRQDRNRFPYPQHLRSFGVARELVRASLDFAKALHEKRATPEHAQDFLSAARLYEYECAKAMEEKTA